MSSTRGNEYQQEGQDYPTPTALGSFLLAEVQDRFPSLKPARKPKYDRMADGHSVQVLDPGCGAGLFLKALCSSYGSSTDVRGAPHKWPGGGKDQARGARLPPPFRPGPDDVRGIELNEARAIHAGKTNPQAMVMHGDVLNDWSIGKFDLIIGNPPFKLTEHFVRVLMKRLHPFGVMAFLQRSNWLGTQERYQNFFTQGHMPNLELRLVKRPMFTPSVSSGKWSTDSSETSLFVWQASTAPKHCRIEFIDNRDVCSDNKGQLHKVVEVDGKFYPVWKYDVQGLETEADAALPTGLTTDTTIPAVV